MRLKRVIEVIAVVFGLLLLGPILAIISVAIRSTSPGPVFFRQARYGKDRRVFFIYKFRTMNGAPRRAEDIGDIRDHHVRATSVGRFLRRYWIDEWPQLLNVLIGDMSLVGPRAHPVGLHVCGTLFEDVVPAYHQRHVVRPGMTGLAQVMGYWGEIDTIEHASWRVAFDLAYIAHRGLVLDLTIVLFTIWRFLLRAGYGQRRFPLHWFGLSVADIENDHLRRADLVHRVLSQPIPAPRADPQCINDGDNRRVAGTCESVATESSSLRSAQSATG